MTDIDGNALSMATDFGLIGYGTLEPGNGTLEEQISFTGLNNNANGTVTLTGVSHVLFVYPYTETSGLAKTHAGATTFIISNTSGFYNKFVAKDDDGMISETLTFMQPFFPQMDGVGTAPSLPAQLTTKSYVDGVAVAGAPNASTTTKGIVQIATRAQYDAGTLVGSTSAFLVVTPNILNSYLVDSGSPNVIVITPSPSISSYVAGQTFTVKVLNTSTSPSVTVNVNGVGAESLYRMSGTSSVSIGAGDVVAGQLIVIEYDGVGFQMETPVASSVPTGSMTMHAGATAPSGWLLCDGTSYLNATYPALFGVISTTYGSADGSHFNVPDMRGRVAVGVGTGTGGGASGTGLPAGGNTLTTVALGAWKGEETHTLTTTEMPAHTHNAGHVNNWGPNGTGSSILNNAGVQDNQTSFAGNGGAHNNIQPVMGVAFIIKT